MEAGVIEHVLCGVSVQMVAPEWEITSRIVYGPVLA